MPSSERRGDPIVMGHGDVLANVRADRPVVIVGRAAIRRCTILGRPAVATKEG